MSWQDAIWVDHGGIWSFSLPRYLTLSIFLPIYACLGLLFAPREVACRFMLLHVLIPLHAGCAISCVRAYMQRILMKSSFLFLKLELSLVSRMMHAGAANQVMALNKFLDVKYFLFLRPVPQLVSRWFWQIDDASGNPCQFVSCRETLHRLMIIQKLKQCNTFYASSRPSSCFLRLLPPFHL
jgi:hypothetical protein